MDRSYAGFNVFGNAGDITDWLLCLIGCNQ